MSDPSGANIYTEPAGVDRNTLANLGPLTGIAGVWEGRRGLDVNPKEAGSERQVFIEHIELQPIDPQTNGPQLFFGLRYHTHIVKPGEVETYHDQVGYWLWVWRYNVATLIRSSYRLRSRSTSRCVRNSLAGGQRRYGRGLSRAGHEAGS